jgi:hypothetical protein
MLRLYSVERDAGAACRGGHGIIAMFGEVGALVEDRHLTKTNVQIVGGGPLPLAPPARGGELCGVEAMLSAHPLRATTHAAEGEDVQST